ncbi:MAG: phytanoyl-CoA dioxygenase family protein [bacterium]|nr:phytanoyl-CoA dioxygenase family protein [bacterium]
MTHALALVAYPHLEQQIEAMERDGFVYFPGFLSADEVAELRTMTQRLEPIAENLDIDLTTEKDGHTQKCINAVFNREVLARATPRQRRLLGEHVGSNYD